MKVVLAFILIGLLVFSCTHIEHKTLSTIDKDSLQKEKIKTTILNDTLETKWITNGNKRLCIPSKNQFVIVDSIILKAIKDNFSIHNERLSPYSYKDYYKQYICYIDSKGDSIVFMNAICEILEFPIIYDSISHLSTLKRFDWQHHLMIVDDGGDCFWSIFVNLTKRIYFRFSVNGVA